MREFSIFHLSKPEWDASKIGVKSNGGWCVFTDPITHKSLNSPRQPYPEPKIVYRRKTEEQLEKEEKIRNWREIKTKKKGNNFNNFSVAANPLLNPPKDNYKEFKARKQLISTKKSNNEFDDYDTLTNSILTSRSMPRKPNKTTQLAKNLQITTLNTQRFPHFSHSSLIGCTPRSQSRSLHYNDDIPEIIHEYDEENTEEVQFTIQTSSINDSATDLQQNIPENDNNNQKERINHLKIAVEEEDHQIKNEDLIKSTNGNQNKNYECEKGDEFDNDNSPIEKIEKSNSQGKSEYSIELEIEEKILDEKSINNNKESQNCLKTENKETTSDDIEIIEFKVDLRNDDSNSTENEYHDIEITTQVDQNKTKDTDIFESNCEIKPEIDKNENKNLMQWKSKRTGKVISRKIPIITKNSSTDNQESESSHMELIKSKSQKIFVHQIEREKNEQVDTNQDEANDKVIHYKFKYNNNRSLNLRRSNTRNNLFRENLNNKRKNANETKERQNNIKNRKINNQKYSNTRIHENNKNNKDVDDESNTNPQILNNNEDITKKKENAPSNNKEKNINNYKINQNISNNINNNNYCDNANSDNNDNNGYIDTNTNSANNNENNTSNNSNTNIDDISNNDNNSNNEIKNTETENNDNKFEPNDDTNNNDIDIIIDIGDEDDMMKAEDSRQPDVNIIIDTTNDSINQNRSNFDDTSIHQIDDYDYTNDNADYSSSNSITDSRSVSSRNKKKVINVYGQNYNDYNYYGNVIRTNSKRNAPGSSSFEFIGANNTSRLGSEISHNYSPLPSTRRPATSTRQRYIERPECIGPERFFKGDNPAPARRFFKSANLVAEMRHDEELKMIANAQVKVNLSKKASRKGPSLFERSVKPREKLYCWPRDFANFSAE